MYEIASIDDGRGQIAGSILRALPDWFGIPASVDAYVADSEHLPMFAARATATGAFVGFLSLKQHNHVCRASRFLCQQTALWKGYSPCAEHH